MRHITVQQSPITQDMVMDIINGTPLGRHSAANRRIKVYHWTNDTYYKAQM